MVYIDLEGHVSNYKLAFLLSYQPLATAGFGSNGRLQKKSVSLIRSSKLGPF
jgi:hypothetical protein